jgi:protein TonB
MASLMRDRILPDERGAPTAGQGGAEPAPVLRLEAWELAQPRQRRSRLVMLASLTGAMLMHAALGLALISGRHEQHGAGGSEMEAISVEVVVVPARALESRVASASRDAAKSASVDQIEGAPEASSSAAQAPPVEHELTREPEKERPLPDPKPEQTAEAMPEPVAEELPPLALTRPDVTPPEPGDVGLPLRQPEPPRPEPEPPKPSQQSAPNPAAEVGGASSRAATGADRPAPAAALASPGAIRAFTRSVVDALARTRPRGVRGAARGTAKVAFAIAEGGGLEFVRLAHSSGHGELDEAAVAAVRRASFPPPPAGMALADRTYEVPYHFR